MSESMKKRLYLASKSPRRRELLTSLGFDVVVVAGDDRTRGYFEGDEEVHPGELPEDYVRRTAETKWQEGWARLQTLPGFEQGLPLIAADTTVSLGNVIYGKPKNAEEAKEFLRTFAGCEHEVRTCVCAGLSPETMRSTVQTSLVRFRQISEDEIEAYVASGEPFDKAGGYGIQGLAGIFIERIEGSFTGIMGLPVAETAIELARLGCPVLRRDSSV